MKTFVVRLHEDAVGAAGAGPDVQQLCGVIDEVATGLRATFRSERELVAALKAAMSTNRAADDPAPDCPGCD